MNEIRLHKLISLWLDGAIEDADLKSLTDTLRENETARHIYLAVMSVNAELQNTLDGKRYLDRLISGEEAQKEDSALKLTESGFNDDNSSQKNSRLTWGFLAVVAASLLIGYGLWIPQGGVNGNLAQLGEEEQATSPDSLSIGFLTNVIPSSEKCHWYVEHAQRREARSYRSGDIIRVIQGRLELHYASGIQVQLESPAAYQLISPMKARMLLGRLTAEVSESGKGFSVYTPRATVVDLGTRFGVEVNDDGATDVIVFKGEVDVESYAQNAEESTAQRLQMGEAVRFDAGGTASRIVYINNRSFTQSLPNDPPSPVIIAEVRDNIERTSSVRNYYEIVHEGMQEDALAFVDREAHQWNGLDEKGIPDYLLGADYVKTFNSDKFNKDIAVSVKLAVPSRLYILFDDRLPVPEWLQNGFRDTGDNIGMDTGPYFTNGQWHNKTPPGVGPGESVEDTLSVWVKEVAEPGTVYLGSTEAPKSEPNMYGIVAARL